MELEVRGATEGANQGGRRKCMYGFKGSEGIGQNSGLNDRRKKNRSNQSV